MEECDLPEKFKYYLDQKLLISAIIYKPEVLKEFFKRVGTYKGPFIVSAFITHTDLMRKTTEIGIMLYKNKQDRCYYIYEEIVIEPVLFNTELLDIPEETT